MWAQGMEAFLLGLWVNLPGSLSAQSHPQGALTWVQGHTGVVFATKDERLEDLNEKIPFCWCVKLACFYRWLGILPVVVTCSACRCSDC